MRMPILMLSPAPAEEIRDGPTATTAVDISLMPHASYAVKAWVDGRHNERPEGEPGPVAALLAADQTVVRQHCK